MSFLVSYSDKFGLHFVVPDITESTSVSPKLARPPRRWSGAGVGVGMSRVYWFLGFEVSWFLGFLVFDFLLVRFLVSLFLVSNSPGSLFSKFLGFFLQSFFVSKTQKTVHVVGNY